MLASTLSRLRPLLWAVALVCVAAVVSACAALETGTPAPTPKAPPPTVAPPGTPPSLPTRGSPAPPPQPTPSTPSGPGGPPEGRPSPLTGVDINLPSESTGSPRGTLALRVYAPAAGHTRYPEGAPVVIQVTGGDAPGFLGNDLPPEADDLVTIALVFPGGTDPTSGRTSDGVYDHRGPQSITALRDVVLYAAGLLTDDQGRTIDEVVPVPVLYDNIGLIGLSNGGNIVVAVAALHGDELAPYLRYIVQWESPVSSQIATVDLGRVRMQCPPGKRGGDNLVNPRYTAYGPYTLEVDYSDLAYNPSDPTFPLFHDGNGDGVYTTVEDPATGCRTPDLDLDGVLERDEDFPLGAYEDGVKHVYSRPATHALAEWDVFGGSWPADIATPEEADAYWDLREAVLLYDEALANIPHLEGMVLTSVQDHVQSAPDKPHIRQAFEGWNRAGAWVQINPDPAYLAEADPRLAGRTDLPANSPNTPPPDWTDVAAYAIPEDVRDATYQLAAVWQMADRAYGTARSSR